MSDKVWTRESLTAQILKDTAGLWQHIEDNQDCPRGGFELLAAVKGGCLALLEGGPFDTQNLLTLAVGMLHTIRELTLEAQEKGQS